MRCSSWPFGVPAVCTGMISQTLLVSLCTRSLNILEASYFLLYFCEKYLKKYQIFVFCFVLFCVPSMTPVTTLTWYCTSLLKVYDCSERPLSSDDLMISRVTCAGPVVVENNRNIVFCFYFLFIKVPCPMISLWSKKKLFVLASIVIMAVVCYNAKFSSKCQIPYYSYEYNSCCIGRQSKL